MSGMMGYTPILREVQDNKRRNALSRRMAKQAVPDDAKKKKVPPDQEAIAKLIAARKKGVNF